MFVDVSIAALLTLMFVSTAQGGLSDFTLVKVLDGSMKPQLPVDCKLPAEIQGAIHDCWRLKPEDRPTAAKLLELFQRHLTAKTSSSSGSSSASAPANDSSNARATSSGLSQL